MHAKYKRIDRDRLHTFVTNNTEKRNVIYEQVYVCAYMKQSHILTSTYENKCKATSSLGWISVQLWHATMLPDYSLHH